MLKPRFLKENAYIYIYIYYKLPINRISEHHGKLVSIHLISFYIILNTSSILAGHLDGRPPLPATLAGGVGGSGIIKDKYIYIYIHIYRL